jgi:hypothetical protein
LASVLTDAVAASAWPAATVFTQPPATLNAPAVVVGWPFEVRYSAVAFSIDEADLPVTVVAGADGGDTIDGLIAVVRAAVLPDPSLAGAVQSATATLERNWRNLSVAGAEVLTADVLVTIQM